ncbi:MAG: hypothetical protein ACK4M7_06130, partial [Burkholderiales bacterium]
MAKFPSYDPNIPQSNGKAKVALAVLLLLATILLTFAAIPFCLTLGIWGVAPIVSGVALIGLSINFLVHAVNVRREFKQLYP